MRKQNKKAAIFTVYSNNNYGNKLQNYAVTHCLNKWGYDAETIAVSGKKQRAFNGIKSLSVKLLRPLVAKKRISMVRTYNIERFSKKYIPIRTIGNCKRVDTDSFKNRYDIFVTGSDQVWNPQFFGSVENGKNMLLMFAPPEKRYCFSPSISVKEIPEKWEPMFKEAWDGYPQINVREESSVEIIKAISGKAAKVTIDPTLMLNREEWLEISTPVNSLPKEYVFEYFLGKRPVNNSDYLEITSKETVVNVLDPSNKEVYTSAPDKFIYMIDKCKLMCTDSFHGCVFSIILGKPFAVFKRESQYKDMFSRIETLLGMFGIDANEAVGKVIQVDSQVRDRVLGAKREELSSMFLS